MNDTVRLLQWDTLKIFTFAPLAPNFPTEPGEPGVPRVPCDKKYQLKGAQWQNQRLTAFKDSLPLEIATESVKILGFWGPQVEILVYFFSVICTTAIKFSKCYQIWHKCYFLSTEIPSEYMHMCTKILMYTYNWLCKHEHHYSTETDDQGWQHRTFQSWVTMV